MSLMNVASQSNGVSKMVHSFSIKWNMSVEDLRSSVMENRNPHDCIGLNDEQFIPIQSKVYKFQGIENLDFALTLGYLNDSYRVQITSGNTKVVKLCNAFIAVKGNLFNLMPSQDLEYGVKLCYLHINSIHVFGEGSITLHCSISVYGHVTTYAGDFEDMTTNRISDYKENDCLIVSKSSVSQEVDATYPAYLREYVFSGKIPTFHESMAKELLAESEFLDMPELKALSADYLYRSLSERNVVEYLELSIDYNIGYLTDACLDLLQTCKIEKNKL